jgi:hypothetical protein
MKVKQSIAIIGMVAGLSVSSVYADDINSVISINHTDEASVNISRSVVNPKITIQDYVDAANGADKVKSGSVANNRSRWEVENTL